MAEYTFMCGDTPECHTEPKTCGHVDCGLCGEVIQHDEMGLPALHEEVGEFVREDGSHVYAHASCGLDNGLEMA